MARGIESIDQRNTCAKTGHLCKDLTLVERTG